MSDFTPINTQEELDAVIGARIAKVKAKAEEEVKASYSGWFSPEDHQAALDQKDADHQKAIDELNSKNASYENEKAELNKQIAGYKRADMIRKALSEFNLNYDDAAQFVKGETEEEIKTSAEALSKLTGVRGGAPLRNPDSPNIDPDKAKIDNMYRGNPWYKG